MLLLNVVGEGLYVWIPVFMCCCLYAFVVNADSCTNVFLPVHQHLPDLDYSVREKQQCVDSSGLKLSTKANNVEAMAISWPYI